MLPVSGVKGTYAQFHWDSCHRLQPTQDPYTGTSTTCVCCLFRPGLPATSATLKAHEALADPEKASLATSADGGIVADEVWRQAFFPHAREGAHSLYPFVLASENR